MTRLFDLLSLPANVFSEVSSFLGSLKEIVRLDSAYCHHHFRETWLHVLGSKPFALHCEVDISVSNQLSWVLQKRLKCSSVKFSLESTVFKHILNFLQEMGSSIRTIFFEGKATAYPMALVAFSCNHLTTLHVRNVTVTCVMREIMLRNPNLQEINFTRVKCSETAIFAGVSLHKLTLLRVYGADCLQGFPWHETAFSDSLRKVVWNNADFASDDLKALFVNCPGLRIFVSNSLTSNDFGAILLNDKLEELYLQGSKTLTDAHVLSLVKHLPLLNMLAVQKCKFLTDMSLQHIAEHAGSQLEELHIDIKNPESAETEAILEVFSQKCTKLEYLDIDSGNKVLCHGKGTSLLVRGCPQLQTLEVNQVSTITASSREFIAQLRPNLRIFVTNL